MDQRLVLRECWCTCSWVVRSAVFVRRRVCSSMSFSDQVGLYLPPSIPLCLTKSAYHSPCRFECRSNTPQGQQIGLGVFPLFDQVGLLLTLSIRMPKQHTTGPEIGLGAFFCLTKSAYYSPCRFECRSNTPQGQQIGLGVLIVCVSFVTVYP